MCPVLCKVTEGFWGEDVDIWGSGLYHVVFYIQQHTGGNAEQSKEAGLAASHLSSCGNMDQDVLPWQPSSTDPLMGCLVCQCDTVAAEQIYMWRMCVCVHQLLVCVCDGEKERKRRMGTKIDGQIERGTLV